MTAYESDARRGIRAFDGFEPVLRHDGARDESADASWDSWKAQAEKSDPEWEGRVYVNAAIGTMVFFLDHQFQDDELRDMEAFTGGIEEEEAHDLSRPVETIISLQGLDDGVGLPCVQIRLRDLIRNMIEWPHSDYPAVTAKRFKEWAKEFRAAADVLEGAAQ